MPVSTQLKHIARHAADVFGTRPRVIQYWDEAERASVEILSCQDTPGEGLSSHSTLRLSEYAIGRDDGSGERRVELVGACATNVETFSNMLATCAFNVINSGFAIYPGAIFKDVVAMYEPAAAMRHLYFTSPFLWEPPLQTLTFGDRQVTWLLAVPISPAEMAYADRHGDAALEDLFESHQVDICDLFRGCTVQ